MRHIILLVVLFISLSAQAQLFFIGNSSYPSSEVLTFKPNSVGGYAENLKVQFVKEGKTPLIAVSTRNVFNLFIGGDLVIFLDDGTAISIKDREKADYVNSIAISLYPLTNADVDKMKNSNTNTIRYSLKVEGGRGSRTSEEDFSASANGIQTKSLVKEFFK